jgi:hypothetical protein
MAKATSFEGDLTDQELVSAKLTDLEAKIEQRERLLRRVEDDLEQLERLRHGLLVILGYREVESDKARAERLEIERKRSEHRRAMYEAQAQSVSIQGQVEHLVNNILRPVNAGDLLEHLPAGTRREAVNYALWRAEQKNRIRRISQGVYASLTIPTKQSNEGR